MKRALLIVNPAARAGLDQSSRVAALQQNLQQAGIDSEAIRTEAPQHAISLARDAKHFDVIVAVGGDGTANEVASGIDAQRAPRPAFAVAPFGTGNDFAHHIRIHGDQDLVGAIASGEQHRIDILRVLCDNQVNATQRVALNFAALGFSSEVHRQTTARMKRWFGPRHCYSVGFFRALLTYRAPLVEARTDDLVLRKRLLFACAANAPSAGGGNMQLAPGALIDDGLMNISLIDAVSPWAAARQFGRLSRGEHIYHPNVRYFVGTKLYLNAEPTTEIAVDGEHAGFTPATITIAPAALMLCAPADPGDHPKR